MAEARQAVSVNVRKRGFIIDKEAEYYQFTVKLPYPSAIWRGMFRFAYRTKTFLINQLFPARPVYLAVVAAAVAYGVTVAERDSWWRDGWLAHALWSVDEWMGWSQSFSLETRVFMLAVQASIVGFFMLMFLQRLLLRALFQYKGWLYQNPRETSLLVILWGAAVKTFSGRKPMLYSFQEALPRQSVPSLTGTVDRSLASIRPLVDDKEYAVVRKKADAFLAHEGPKLQRYLWLKSWWATNYVTDWWEKYVYHRGRDPIMINSNYYVLDASCGAPSRSQVGRAAWLCHNFMKFKREIDRETLAPMLIRGTVPLCMNQYKRMFGSTRIPGREGDYIEHRRRSTHMVVMRCGRFYTVRLVQRGKLLSPVGIERQLDWIISDAKLGGSDPTEAEAALPALTAGNRTRWALERENHFLDGLNGASMKQIESAAFMLSLDDGVAPKTWTERGKALLHGSGTNRWFDKSVSLVAFPDGRVGLNAEHSWADAPVLAHMMEHCVTTEMAGNCYGLDGRNREPGVPSVVSRDSGAGAGASAGSPSGSPIRGRGSSSFSDAEVYDSHNSGADSDSTTGSDSETGGDSRSGSCRRGSGRGRSKANPRRLYWDLSRDAERAIFEAKAEAEELINDLDLQVVTHDTYGKGFMKKCGVSPDAYIQLCLQLAYRRDSGKFEQTYESSMTRLFRDGRTETVRPCSMDSTAFVRAMIGETTANKDEKIALFRKAAETHQAAYRNAMSGLGVDRHLFALYIVSKGLSIESKFLMDVLGRPWRLSTSQQPQQQTTNWKKVFDMIKEGSLKWLDDNGKPLKKPTREDVYSPGGGFGPVADDGYGVSYMITGENRLYFHISSKKRSDKTDSSKFHQAIIQAFADVQELMAAEAAASDARKAAKAKAKGAGAKK